MRFAVKQATISLQRAGMPVRPFVPRNRNRRAA
jgi:hypothetical protein